MPSASLSKLFQPIKVGNMNLAHRVVHAPMTRLRTTNLTRVPIMPLVKEYYSQRSSTPGTLIICEGMFIAPKAGGWPNIPGMWSKEQIDAWKEITDAVHKNGSYIILQLVGVGRAADPAVLAADDPTFTVVAPSAIPLSSSPSLIPHELSATEMKEYMEMYAQAAKNGVIGAGFDGVEIHCANGYLVDQFLQDVSNNRTDEYGGSVEARSRFGLEVVDAVAKAVGAEKTAVRISPWSIFQDMKMDDPIPQFTHFVSTLRDKYPELAYLHVIESRVTADDDSIAKNLESNDFVRALWKPRPYISSGGHTRETALRTSERTGELIAFGRMYTSNPDLPTRLKRDIPLTLYNRKMFYRIDGQENPEVGYINYPFSDVNGITA